MRSLVPAAAGVRARLARGEVFGSHAGGVLRREGGEEGQQGPRQGRGSQRPPRCGPQQDEPEPSPGRQMGAQCTAGRAP